jgi:fructuronate reductase
LSLSDRGAAALAVRLRVAADDTAAANAALGYAPVFGADPWPPAFAARLAAHLATLRQGGMAALLAS